MAISRQNSRSTSRRRAGAPGDFIADRPVNACIHPVGLPINTSAIKVLRRPVESAQYTSFRYATHLADLGVMASVGSVADACDNAMAEVLNGTFKAELIHRRTWRTRDQVELAVVEWVAWYNHQRLYSAIDNIPPVEFEADYYRSFNAPAPTGAR